jgi:hypothetical protein
MDEVKEEKPEEAGAQDNTTAAAAPAGS